MCGSSLRPEPTPTGCFGLRMGRLYVVCVLRNKATTPVVLTPEDRRNVSNRNAMTFRNETMSVRSQQPAACGPKREARILSISNHLRRVTCVFQSNQPPTKLGGVQFCEPLKVAKLGCSRARRPQLLEPCLRWQLISTAQGVQVSCLLASGAGGSCGSPPRPDRLSRQNTPEPRSVAL